MLPSSIGLRSVEPRGGVAWRWVIRDGLLLRHCLLDQLSAAETCVALANEKAAACAGSDPNSP